ncbi:MAG: anaerobic ribonucleoside-triphosphate reductase activating protein [Spirochaetes bacterium]|nr:anaerobic ribonucleoside-triphosphate reductase activating protein [Spirochaetota bacterium]
MIFYGVQKTSLLDYPGEVAATLFTGGCNFRCPFCHNSELVFLNNTIAVEWSEIHSFLKKRNNVLGGVCITGGEPLCHDQLKDIIPQIKKLGLKVKVDTNGTFPEKLITLDVDFIAMDIKSSLSKYHLFGYQGNKDLVEQVQGSIEYLIKSGINYEFRTTVVPELVTLSDIKQIAQTLKGAKKYVLSQFRPQKTLDPSFEQIIPYPVNVLEEMQYIIEEQGIPVELRANY